MSSLLPMQKEQVLEKVRQARELIVRMICRGGGGHLGGALSCLDLMAVLYFHILRNDPNKPNWDERDRFILSAGHKCLALYAMLALRGYFDARELDTYGSMDCAFPGHPDRRKLVGVEANTGSLGHGLAIGGGMALAAKRDALAWRVFVLLGDGEITEGTVWESAAAASHYELDNLVAIVDKNALQIQGATREVMNMDPLAEKWRSFGWSTIEVNGHDLDAIYDTLGRLPREQGRPTAVIAHTTKGKGLEFAEGNYAYHYWKPSEQECRKLLAQLQQREESHE